MRNPIRYESDQISMVGVLVKLTYRALPRTGLDMEVHRWPRRKGQEPDESDVGKEFLSL